MNKKTIYITQFEMGGSINLIPFAAGILISNLKKEQDILESYHLSEIIIKRDDPELIVSRMEHCAIIAFCCSLWNLGFSLRVAQEVRKKFPDAWILFGGSAVPVAPNLAEKFLLEHPVVDVICKGEGEELIVEICRKYAKGDKNFDNVQGIIYRDEVSGNVRHTPYRKEIAMEKLSSPYLDGTFDDLWDKYGSVFSGAVMETTRGCPFQCTFCWWGFAPYRAIREKPMQQIKSEIEWMGRHKVGYISLINSNFGISKNDVEIAKMFAECKKKYSVPNFISVSWVKNSSPEAVKVAAILREAGIANRVTLSLQSINPDVLKAVKRYNLSQEGIERVKANYHQNFLYCYTELILCLPLETYDSFMEGIEKNLGETIFDQVFMYLLYLFSNTQLGSSEDREKYQLEGKIILNRQRKNKESQKADEYSEVVVASSTMPRERWADAFVEGNYILAIHDNRLAFFILRYLRKEYDIKITELMRFIRKNSVKENFSTIKKSIEKMEVCSRDVQEGGESQYIEAEGYDSTLHDPCDAIFLELIDKRNTFYPEFFQMVESYLKSINLSFDHSQLKDIFLFQEAIMAHPQGPISKSVKLKYDWITYFQFTFNCGEKRFLQESPLELDIVDPKPSQGDYGVFVKERFSIRGVPAFNDLFDREGNKVFPIDISPNLSHIHHH